MTDDHLQAALHLLAEMHVELDRLADAPPAYDDDGVLFDNQAEHLWSLGDEPWNARVERLMREVPGGLDIFDSHRRSD